MRPVRMITVGTAVEGRHESGEWFVIKKMLIGAVIKKIVLPILVIAIVVGGVAYVAKAETVRPAQAGCQALEDCFTKKQMKKFVKEFVRPYVDDFFVATYGEDAQPDVVFIKKGKAVETGCDIEADDTAYFHCGVDGTIYLGQNQVWDFYKNVGDIAPILAYAHEWGHHIQTLSGVEKVDQETAIATENQADCIAGGWLQDVDQQGLVDYPDDIEDIDLLLQEVASAEEDVNRDHGTIDERNDSVLLGFENGLAACNDFFPDTPVYAAE